MNERHPNQPIAHFVGSIPLSDAPSVFKTLCHKLGDHVERIPDGETGRRARWISFIADQLKAHPDFEVDPDLPPFQFKQWDGVVVWEIERLRFREGVDPARTGFNTGYADDAIRNHAEFKKLKAAGVIPARVKYQICMASPLAITYNFMSPGIYDAFIPVYSAHLAAELGRISDSLPHDEISYQWDVCQEVLMWEGYYYQPPGYTHQIVTTLGEIGDWVPPGIDLGYHLCYGSPKDEHMVQPRDMTVLVEIANGIAGAVTRPIRYIHMPVPKDRDDAPYFQPLSGLRLAHETGLYLGLVHAGDPAGNAAKLAQAQQYAPVAGVAAECGLGRGDPEKFDQILAEHGRLVGAQ